ncbi:hypothetical protein M758_10G149300 [Ceratodon purpureus]|nr:hypothetical protein M758_10G149300 [Ceratodon purpureus]
MLLNQFKTGSNASSLVGSSRDGLVLTQVRKTRKSETLQVKATTGEPKKGWLESASTRLEKVGGFLEKKLGGDGTSTAVLDPNMVEYKGKAMIMKKLLQLDLIDRAADLADDASELFLGKHVTIQLVSTETDPSTGKGKLSDEVIIPKWVATFESLAAQDIEFKINFQVPKDFGVPGAIIVKNEHPNEFLLVSFNLTLPDNSAAHFITHSWVYNTNDKEGRIFFRNKTYLPAETPESLKELREKELALLRGDGTGERKECDRIYDYQIYNDLGDPDKNESLERPNLGGNPEFPFPRRCRSGRKLTTKFPEKNYESRDVGGPLGAFYIPRDECFDRSKMSDFRADGVRSIGHSVASKVIGAVTQKKEFDSIAEIKRLYAKKGEKVGGLNNVLPDEPDLPKEEQHPLVFLQEVLTPDGKTAHPLKYPLPQLLQSDEHAWQNNDEFAREFLAGLNPVVIERVKEWPMKSTLAEFGCPVSTIKDSHIEGSLEELSVEEAVSNKRLFVANYHDAFLPYVAKINEQLGAKTYATRALFFLASDQTLKTLALELALPGASPKDPLNARVFTPPTDTSKTDYVWEMAKAHVSNNDITAHQVFSHFTRCHAVTEAVIIASNRNLSRLHPIMQLMAPHYRSTLEINRTARATLIAAGGSIETHFTPKKYSMELAAANYRDTWTFESQALPNDLVARGMAERDESAPHGVKLVVEDYPYAADGLELWGAIQGWNKEYVDIYYKDDNSVLADPELQAWWKEMREKGHEDKKDAPGWPELNSKESLAEILTTIQWIPSCQHAAVNFGQYDYAGWMPQHPTMVRRLIPEEGSAEWDVMMKNPEKYYLSTIANIDSTTTAMSVYEVLSAHSPKEEYIGQRPKEWTADEQACAAFKRFTDKIKEVDGLIKARNADPNLKNRHGVVNMPYQLLRPWSKPGVTAMGVPNSITI